MSFTLSATDTLNAKAGTNTAITYTLLGDAIASGVDSFKNLGQGQLTTSASTPIYPATAGTQTVIREIQFANTTGSDVTGVTLYINGSAAANQISAGFTIPANGSAGYRDGLFTIYSAVGLPISTSSVTLTGDVTGAGAGTIPTTVGKINGTSLAGLSTGLLKNTTTTGVPSIAVASTDYIGATTGSAIQKASSGGLTAAVAADVPVVAAGGTGALNATDTSVTNSRTPSGSAGGDLTGTYPNPTLLATVNPNVGSFGSTTQVGTFSVNAKGLTTAAGNTTITPAVGSITGLGTGVGTWLATPSSANLASAMTDETGSGSLVFANVATMKPKDISGTVYVDTANTQGWAGADYGAWVNSAYSYIHTTYSDNNGGIIESAPGSATFATPIVLANAGLMSVQFRGAGDGNGSTILNFTATSGICLAYGGGSGNDGGVQIKDFTITGTAQGNGATAISVGATGIAGCAGSTISNVSIRRFTNGITWLTNSSAYAVNLLNVKVQQTTNALTPFGENNIMVGGLIGGNATGILANAAAEMQLFGVAFDDNTTTAINMSSANARFSLDGCRFENAGAGTSVYITQSNGSISMVSGAFQNDVTSGTPATGFVQMTGGVAKYDGVWHGFQGAQSFTQVYNASSPASIQVVNPIVSPGSNVATGLAGLNWLPAAYSMALETATATSTTTETIMFKRIVPLNTTDMGTTLVVGAWGTQNTTLTASLIWKLHFGPLGTTGDPIVWTTTAVAMAASAGGGVTGMATIRTVGTTGTILGGASAQGTAPGGTINPTAVLANTTQTNILTLTATAAAGVFTTQAAYIEQKQPN